MSKITMLFVIAALAVVVTGCGQKPIDCKNPVGKEAKAECAHRASTDTSGISPTHNPKKW